MNASTNYTNMINTAKMLGITLPSCTAEEAKAANKHRNVNKNRAYREAVVDAMHTYYKSPTNRKMYGEYIKLFEKAGENPALQDVLIKAAINTAGYDAWMSATKGDLKYYRVAFAHLFSEEVYEGLYRSEHITRAKLYKKAVEQKFICPHCGGKLDIDIKDGPLKVTADHITCQKRVGRKLGMENIVAVHAACNCYKHTATALIGGPVEVVEI